MKVILHLTPNCNLSCKYCYASINNGSSMSIETAKKGIDLAVKEGINSACVSYFGGEPLLFFDKIKTLTLYAVEEGKKHNKEMHFRLSTNGTLFNEEILAFCKKYNILFAISLDGDEKAHDSSRITKTGEGSFKIIDEKLDMILKYNPYSVFASVITPLNCDRLYESMEYMWSRGIRYVAHAVDYNDPDWTMELFEKLTESYKKLSAWYIDKTRSGNYFYMNLFDDKLKTHAKSPFKIGEICDFGKSKVSIAPNGRIYPCVRFVSDNPDTANYLIGNVDDGFTNQRQHLISKNKDAGRPQCEDCVLMGRCANYCGCTNWDTTGSISTVHPMLCEHERMLIPIADEIGNILWKEKNLAFLKKHYKIDKKLFPLLFGYSLD
jgi:uncharacterized protein